MKLEQFSFGTTDWAQVPCEEKSAQAGQAFWRTQQFGEVRVRMVEYTPGYVSDHWCKSLFTVFSWCPQGSTRLQSRRAPPPRLDAWARCATLSAALCCLARRVAPQKRHLLRCPSSPGHRPGCGGRLAPAAFAGQRAL